jgi:(2R)-sulfolactate sulfo-lyase subunit alpha
MTIHFVVHDEGDSVGVVVVEGLDRRPDAHRLDHGPGPMIEFDAQSTSPIGHKLAIKPIARATTIIKYGVDIGKAVADIGAGEHLHVHNVKTKRW